MEFISHIKICPLPYVFIYTTKKRCLLYCLQYYFTAILRYPAPAPWYSTKYSKVIFEGITKQKNQTVSFSYTKKFFLSFFLLVNIYWENTILLRCVTCARQSKDKYKSIKRKAFTRGIYEARSQRTQCRGPRTRFIIAGFICVALSGDCKRCMPSFALYPRGRGACTMRDDPM